MEHIVQFAIGIDDEAIRNRVVDTAEKVIIDNIANDVKLMMFARDGWSGKPSTNFNVKMEKKIDELVQSNRDEIVDRAAVYLADKLARSKAVREKITKMMLEDPSE